MYPHNWNLVFKWNVRTSNLLRDWLLLQLRRGITTDDQATLFAAEQRARAVGGLRVGQMPTGMAAAFYSPTRTFFPRVTRVIQGPAYLLHCSAPPQEAKQWCASFNARNSRRQMWMPSKASIKSFATVSECRQELAVKKCPFAGGGPQSLGPDVFEAATMRPPAQLKLGW